MAFDLTIPRIMIAAPGSGSGKTLITCALLRILERRQLKAAAFKCGPDFIDPMFHRSVLQVPSRNLDLFLAGEEGVRKTLLKGSSGRDIAVLEGVMGLFDGMSFASDENSSYDIAVRTETPVILVVNCAGMGRSVIPLVKGFCGYGASGADDSGMIRGVILNNTSLEEIVEFFELLKLLHLLKIGEIGVHAWKEEHEKKQKRMEEDSSMRPE